MHKKFDNKAIEKKWQKIWKESSIYKTNIASNKPKAYVLDMFPYPSGEGLHVGHPKGYIATDVYSRFKKMSGYEVLHPMGWDAFGLPAENYAIKNKIHPRIAVEKNIANFKSQLAELGFNYDWDKEINTTDPAFMKWTQWIFLRLLSKGLAVESYEPINWCPSCQTGLANEDLESDGTCERCGSVVEKKPMRQWVLKITDYADRMLSDLDTLQWPEHIKEAQRNWIGRKDGAEITFKLSTGDTVNVFTTRPDTLYGVTYLVLAPEHKLIEKVRGETSNFGEVEAYVALSKQKAEQDRLDATKEKTGVKLESIVAINPASGEEIPVYIADYVLGGYGTGAIMAVPAHDERDNAFAQKFGIPIKQVIAAVYNQNPNNTESRHGVYAIIENDKNEYLLQYYRNKNYFWLPGGGIETNESEIECLNREIIEETGYTNFEIQGKSVDIFYDYEVGDHHTGRNRTSVYSVKIDFGTQQALQLEPDEVEDGIEMRWVHRSQLDQELAVGAPSRSALIKHAISISQGAIYTEAGSLVNSGEFNGMNSEEAKQAIVKKVGGRMTSTYRLKDWVFSRQRYWGEPIPIVHCEGCGVVPVPDSELPVCLPEVENYAPTGTGESPLADIADWVNTTCPTCKGKAKRETNTMPQWAGSSWYYLRFADPQNATALIDKDIEKKWLPVDVYVGGDHAVRHLIYARFWHKFLFDIGVVHTLEPFTRLEFLGFILAEDGRKMSKRWGNIINPSDIVSTNGADALRVYEMFMGPFENTIAWSKDGIVGSQRFLERVHGLSSHIRETEDDAVTRQLHKTITKVSDDIEGFKFNTAISAMMIFLNVAEKEGLSKESYGTFLKLLSPFAPHLCEELWSTLGHTNSVHLEAYPVANSELASDTEVTIGVQINGKTRGNITISKDATEAEVLHIAQQSEVLSKYLTQEITKIIYVPGRIINIIVKTS